MVAHERRAYRGAATSGDVDILLAYDSGNAPDLTRASVLCLACRRVSSSAR